MQQGSNSHFCASRKMNPKSGATAQTLLMNLALTSCSALPFYCLASLTLRLSLPSVSPHTSDWCEDHRGFSMDGCTGQYPERIAAQMRVTWESREAEKTLKAKWSKKEKKKKQLWNTSNSNLRLWNSCPAAKLQSRIDSFFYLFLRFLLCPLATPPFSL